MNKKIAYILIALQITQHALATTEVVQLKPINVPTVAENRLSPQLISILKRAPLAFTATVCLVHSFGIGAVLLPPPLALAGFAASSLVLAYPEKTKQGFAYIGNLEHHRTNALAEYNSLQEAQMHLRGLS